MLTIEALQASVMAHLEANFTAAPVAWPGAEFAIEGVEEWVEPHLLAVIGRVARVTHTAFQVMMDFNVFARRSAADAYRASRLVDSLRAALERVDVAVHDYDETGEPTVTYLRFGEATVRFLGAAPTGRPTEVEQTHVSLVGRLDWSE